MFVKTSSEKIFPAPGLSCPYCFQTGKIQMHFSTRFFLLKILPMFPFQKRSHVICTSCNRRLEKNQFINNFDSVHLRLKNEYKHPKWTWLGTLICIAMMPFVIISDYLDGKNTAKYLDQPMAGDFYIMKQKNLLRNYYAMKIISVKKDSITFICSRDNYWKERKLRGHLEDLGFFTGRDTVIAVSEIKKARADGSLINVERED